MTEIIFIYGEKKVILLCDLQDKFKEIFNTYSSKINENIEKLKFFCDNQEINEESQVFKYLKENNNKNNKLNIIVKSKDNYIINENKNYIQSRGIQKEDDLIIAKYKINEKIIKIFGSSFVKKNKNNCKIIYEEKEFELKDKFEIDNNFNKDILEIKLKGISKISDISDLFSDCTSLISLSGISNIDMSKYTNIQGIFNGCLSLLSLPDISKWDTSNIIDMSFLFNNCQSLSFLPDISNWNTINVFNMSFLFNGCISLTTLPDISKWKINDNVIRDMIFGNCFSLSYIPDIFNLNSKNNYLFVYTLIGSLKIGNNFTYNCINNICDKP